MKKKKYVKPSLKKRKINLNSFFTRRDYLKELDGLMLANRECKNRSI